MAGTFYLLDTFSKEKFKGNPTPVCVPEKPLSVQAMHSLAKEFNAPVTVFVEPVKSDNNYPVRYFTVTGEIPACGHATLGAAFVLFSQTGQEQIVFETIEKVRLKARKGNGITLIEYPRFERSGFDTPVELLEALGIKDSKTIFFCHELQSLFIELQDEAKVKQLQPDYERLTKSSDQVKEVVVMCKAESKAYDFVLRSFCPWIGINEDPVTGSIHSVLGHFWKERLNKNELVAYQASERGGHLFIKPLPNAVEIGGYAEIIIEGRLSGSL